MHNDPTQNPLSHRDPRPRLQASHPSLNVLNSGSDSMIDSPSAVDPDPDALDVVSLSGHPSPPILPQPRSKASRPILHAYPTSATLHPPSTSSTTLKPSIPQPPLATTAAQRQRTPSPTQLAKDNDRDTDTDKDKADLEDFERSDGRPAFVLTWSEVKLLGITGVGFFLDAYDLFIINPVATMLKYRLYNGDPLPANLEGFLKAGTNIGSVIGQFGFGYAADALGRKAVYGKELILIILSTILCITLPTSTLSPDSCLIYLTLFRILLGVGIGGDYPMSASITSDRANVRKRGTMLAYIFSNQGWGSLVGSVVVIVVLECYKGGMDGEGRTSLVDGVWRICIGVSLIPAFGTLYQRLTLGESKRFKNSQKLSHPESGNHPQAHAQGEGEEGPDEIEMLKLAQKAALDPEGDSQASSANASMTRVERVIDGDHDGDHDHDHEQKAKGKKPSHFKEFLTYFSEWEHAKILIATCGCWFLLDVAFYGINLNQNIVLQQMGFDGSSGSPWYRLYKVSTGGIIITALGFVPGYYATILTIEYLGRKWIQIQGFLLAALFLAILAAKFHTLNTVAFIACFACLQFFFNFGANATTYCYPAEVFPTKFKATAHGISAAAGKTGAIISALVFNTLVEKIGTPGVMWIFVGCCIAGAFLTVLLPEVKGRDPDLVLAEEIRVKRLAASASVNPSLR